MAIGAGETAIEVVATAAAMYAMVTEVTATVLAATATTT